MLDEHRNVGSCIFVNFLKCKIKKDERKNLGGFLVRCTVLILIVKNFVKTKNPFFGQTMEHTKQMLSKII